MTVVRVWCNVNQWADSGEETVYDLLRPFPCFLPRVKKLKDKISDDMVYTVVRVFTVDTVYTVDMVTLLTLLTLLNYLGLRS